MSNVILITGPSGSGKTSASIRFANAMNSIDRGVIRIDGDYIRQCWPGLGYTVEDRKESCCRIFEMVKALFPRGDITIIVSAVMPEAASRDMFRREFGKHITDINLPDIIVRRDEKFYNIRWEESTLYKPHIVGMREVDEHLQGFEYRM